MLQHQVDHLLAKHMEDSTVHDEAVRQLNSELDAKANAIALLTQQLYQTRTRLRQEIEEKAQKPTGLCVCTHCLVHQKTLRNVSAADGRLSPLHESDSISLSEEYSREASSADSAVSNRWLSPPPQSTPPISPRPPPPSAARSHSIKRRASTPIRRQSPSPKSTQSASATRDHSHHSGHHQQRSLRPALAAKDTGKLSSELQQLLSLKDREVKVSRRRQTHPILPPIASSSNLTEGSQDDGGNSSSVNLDRSPSGHYICATVPVPMATDSPQLHHHHRRLILAKSKGLSSAPSKLRVVRYSSCGRGEGEEVRGGGGGDGDEEGARWQRRDLAAGRDGSERKECEAATVGHSGRRCMLINTVH